MAARSSEKKKNNEDLTPEQINAQFNQLRQEQRAFLSKIGELEMDYSEHSMVIENLKIIAPDRKCFRLVGGVLVERTVKDVLPALVSNRDKIKGLVQNLNDQLKTKSDELNVFKEQHNIRLLGEKQQDEKMIYCCNGSLESFMLGYNIFIKKIRFPPGKNLVTILNKRLIRCEFVSHFLLCINNKEETSFWTI
ncbi:prefoldin subunit 2-like isoform X1 [Xenia sp. Carnegie-2017]|uniref:prefoldin subunit 2-like isoform X1 n=1 Tax=Xenia sp. Carnegie-2017 TaxID=2897299 RepID=UPI001F04791F|nr:prefoldin subunit 2-like isoform X1 [Xenia sp. Carnegie-2017]